ncbi:hypothetical protein [Bdellovibrio sp.]|uniref:hypothetical protein n=1 Tax=Bdellovibrio TaxID=958 RepID=UPI0032221050
MKKGILLCISLLFISFSAPAAKPFEPDHWSKGLHLLAGGGVNSSVYSASEERVDGGLGLNIKTDLLYVLDSNWALEWSANVKFNQVRSYLLWDTLLTLGVRRQVPRISPWDLGAPYARFFIGRAPTVLFLNGGQVDQISDPNVSRLHFDGPVAGFGWGALKKNTKGQIWFTELSFSIQALEQEEGVRMDGDVPVVVASTKMDDNSNIYSFTWTIGILAF